MFSHLQYRNWVWWSLLPALWVARLPADGQTIDARAELASADAVRALSVTEAQKKLPVRLFGVVTYHEPLASLTFVQDDTAGIYVSVARNVKNVHVGDSVEVVGITMAGRFAPAVFGVGSNFAEVRVWGEAALPKPLRLSGTELNNPANDCQWVEVRGTVKKVSSEKMPLAERSRAVLQLDVEGESLPVVIPEIGGAGELPDHLIGARVSVRGVFGTLSNERRQLTGKFLYVQTLTQVVVEESNAVSSENLPLSSAVGILQFTGGDASRRVRVRGTVLWRHPQQGLYLRADGIGLFVQSGQVGEVRRGDAVEVVGYANPAPPKPYIRDAIFRVVGPGAAAEPRRLVAGQYAIEDQHADLITLDAELLTRQNGPDECVLGLRHDNVLLEAHLNSLAAAELGELGVGSRLRLTGIGIVNYPTLAATARGALSLLLRDAQDVTVLARPPWLTIQRAGLILSVLVAACGLGGLWIYLLRRRVEQQMFVIRGHITREAVHDERSRIARDFHDTVQQQLAGINIALQTTDLILEQSPAEARKSVALSRQMIRHTLAETRQTIWDLRSPALEHGGLVAALEEFAANLHKSSRAQIEVQVIGAARRLSGVLEQGLFRIAQEALTNALKHGQASHCTVVVDFSGGTVHLRVQDNGCGFQHGQAPGGGELHFGLLGMQERANKLRAAFDIRSQPGKGTMVEVTAETPL